MLGEFLLPLGPGIENRRLIGCRGLFPRPCLVRPAVRSHARLRLLRTHGRDRNIKERSRRLVKCSRALEQGAAVVETVQQTVIVVVASALWAAFHIDE